MASSRGRERLRERQSTGHSFVFGSSTPRDLSHMNKVPRQYRTYDKKVETEKGSGPSISEYMRKARSLTREGSDRGGWAFGSSTPRDLSHITGVPKKFRVYDVQPERKLTVTHMTRSITVGAPQSRTPLHNPFLSKRTDEDEDVNSEPDLVQDRDDYFSQMREKSRLEREKREEEGAEKTENGTRDVKLPPNIPRDTKVRGKKVENPKEEGEEVFEHVQTMDTPPEPMVTLPTVEHEEENADASLAHELQEVTVRESSHPTVHMDKEMREHVDKEGADIQTKVVDAMEKTLFDTDTTVSEVVRHAEKTIEEVRERVVEEVAEKTDVVVEAVKNKMREAISHAEGTVNRNNEEEREDVDTKEKEEEGEEEHSPTDTISQKIHKIGNGSTVDHQTKQLDNFEEHPNVFATPME